MSIGDDDDEHVLLRSVALQNARVVLLARQRAERELVEAKEALRAANERLEFALAAGHLGYWEWEAASDAIRLGSDAAAILGVPRDRRLTWAQLRERLHAGDRDRERRAAERALADGGDYDVEYRLGDGAAATWIAARGRGTYAADGTVLGMIGVVQDLTDRKRVDEALREREERLRATFSQAAVGFAIAGLDGAFQELNPKFSEILGYPEGELLGKSFVDVTHPDDLGATKVMVDKLLDGSVPDYTIEKRYLRKDGAIVWSHTTVTLLTDRAGRPSRFIGVIEDITPRKRAEEALRDERGMLEMLNRTGAAIASELDLAALLQIVIDAATALTGAQLGAFFYNGVSGDEAAPRLVAITGGPREAFAHLGMPQSMPVFSPIWRGEAPVRVADLTPADAPMRLPARSCLAVPVMSRSKEVFGALFFWHAAPGVFTDRAERLAVGIAAQAATAIDNARLYEAAHTAAEERKRLLESEQAARAYAERMSELKDEFLATVSHELRTPLGAILGWSQILRTRRPDDPDLARALEVIERNAHLQAQLIDDLLDTARITSGQLRLDVQVIDLITVVEAALDTVTLAADAKGIHLDRRLDRDVGRVSGDPSRLQQVVWNLLSNAIKFTPNDGRIAVALARVGSHIELRVTDTGIGITTEFLPHVFERFRQADGSSTRKHAGLGLGLAIARHLVELHGGSLTAASPGAGQGATFTMRLPNARTRDLAAG